MNTFRPLIILIFIISLITAPMPVLAQFTNKWMAVGSLHNWFSEVGCEIEEGFYLAQQYGLRWPAIHKYQDSQAAKALWIGAVNFTDETGSYPYKVVHVGPRVTGEGEFFPIRFETISKFDPPKVFVDGVLSVPETQVKDVIIDESLIPDRMIINEVNTLLGITMTRKIMQFSQEENDNYMIYEYTFKNTGNTDYDEDIELPVQALEGVYFFWQYRYSACRQTRYVVGNGSGWGMNTMMDARGDGPVNPELYGDPENERMRCQFAWHGYWPDRVVPYDNIGAPIWTQDQVDVHYVTERDTVGRLGAPQFVGVVTLHADKATDDPTDDPEQPRTTGYYGSDEPNTTNNDAYNTVKMESEYEWMTRGHMTPRHAWKAEPSGDFSIQTAAPHFDPGGPGGFSIGDGFGPYTIGRGDSIVIVIAEGAAGLSRERCIELGIQYKKGEIDDKTKNEWVLTGKDSLMKTFRNALTNFENGYEGIVQPPKPPKNIYIDGGGDRIKIAWETYEDDPNLTGFKIYRQTGDHVDPLIPPELVYEAGPDEREFNDTTPVRGVAYYYFIKSVGQNGLESNRHYTQAYIPAYLKRPAGSSMKAMRVVPNPYILGSSEDRLRFSGEPDKLAFFNIPGQCTIHIYTEIGELIYSIEHTDGSGDAYWNGVTSSNQVVVSGIYLAVITDAKTGDREILKFVVIR